MLWALRSSALNASVAMLEMFMVQQQEQAEQAAERLADLEQQIRDAIASELWDQSVDWSNPEAALERLKARLPSRYALTTALRTPNARLLGSLAPRDCPTCLIDRKILPLSAEIPSGDEGWALYLDLPLITIGDQLGLTRQGSHVWWATQDGGQLLAALDEQWIGTDLRAASGECLDAFERVLHAPPNTSGTARYCWPEDGVPIERTAGYQTFTFFGIDTVIGVSAFSRDVLAPMEASYRATLFAASLICGLSILIVLLNIRAFRARTAQERTDALNTISALNSALEARDPYTRFHSENVSLYGQELARRMGLPEPIQEAVRLAGLMHDIGKIGICDGVLNKPGRLTPEERKAIERHAEIGEHILCHLSWAGDLAKDVGAHHEKLDGTGYPRGLQGEEIPLNARIIAVADVFDALVTDRPYRAGMPLPKVLLIIEEMTGNHLDKTVVDALMQDPIGLLRMGRGVGRGCADEYGNLIAELTPTMRASS